MIFAEQIDYEDPLYESYLNEAFTFKTKAEAEKALEKVSDNENGLSDYIGWMFRMSFLSGLCISGAIVIPIYETIIKAFSKWIAFPGSVSHKIRKCEKIIKKCDRTIDQLNKKDDPDSKKLIDEYEKVRKHIVEEKKSYEKRAKELGVFGTNSSLWKESEAVTLFGNNGGSYIHDALYESYVQAKINSEDRLAFALKESMVISESDYSNIRALQEAKLTDSIKAKWKKFVAFIKGLVAKFMESMSNILLDEKAYLEKYKDIILKKKPKEDLEYSYTGNYKVGIDRIISTEVPLFDYYKYKKQFDAEDDEDLIRTLMQGKNFDYNDGETLAEQFKNYFLAYDDGEQKGKFSDLNMTDMYNFCYNFNKIKGIVDKDISRLDASTRAIESAINKELNATTNTVEKVEEPAESNNNSAKNQQQSQQQSSETKVKESAILEKVEISGNNAKPSTDPTKNMSSTNERDNDAEKNAATAGAAVAKSDGKEAADITKAADRWIRVCNPLISAKLTACQQISKDYMDIIRAHVRSYGGTDKKSKEGDKAPDKGSKYSKNPDVAKAQQDAEKANKDAEAAETKK